MTESNTKSIEPLKMLRLRDVTEMVALQQSSIYAKIKKGEFPTPIKIGYASRWLESEVIAWVEKQIAATRGEIGTD